MSFEISIIYVYVLIYDVIYIWLFLRRLIFSFTWLQLFRWKYLCNPTTCTILFSPPSMLFQLKKLGVGDSFVHGIKYLSFINWFCVACLSLHNYNWHKDLWMLDEVIQPEKMASGDIFLLSDCSDSSGSHRDVSLWRNLSFYNPYSTCSIFFKEFGESVRIVLTCKKYVRLTCNSCWASRLIVVVLSVN